MAERSDDRTAGKTSEDSDIEDNAGAHPNASTSGACDRREDNPFSFKHFLRNDKGARPKVYCEGKNITSVSDLEIAPEMKQTRVEYPTSAALPDFVQDHLVVEQCFLGSSGTVPGTLMLDLMPDCTPSRDSVINRLNTSSHNNNQRCGDSNLFLDLPGRPPNANFPLDLPLGSTPQWACAPSEV